MLDQGANRESFVLSWLAMVLVPRKRLICWLFCASASLARGSNGPFLEIYGAGMNVGDDAPVLRNGDSYCVNTQPFTIFCKGMKSAKSVIWNFKGRDIAEDDSPPFSVAGERNGVPRAWKGFEGSGTLRCSSSNSVFVEVFLDANCEVTIPTAATSSNATTAREQPSYTSTAPSRASDSVSDNFIVFSSLAYLNPEGKLPAGWKAKNNGLTFRQGGGSWIAPAPNGNSGFLSYAFVAPGNFTYGFAMDSSPGPTNTTSRSMTEHNDVYVRLRNPGFTRRRLQIVGENLEDVTKKSSVAWLKVYQNQAARSWQAATTDNLPDYLSTTDALIVGNTYVLHVAGRSTDFTVHGFCMFPCSGRRCSRQTVFWREQEKLCSFLRDA